MLKHRWMGFVSFKGCKYCVKLRVELNLEAKRRSPTLWQCLIWPERYWLKCTCWPQLQTFFSFLPNLCVLLHTCCVYVYLSHTHTYTRHPFLPLSLFSCSVLQGWGQWKMAQVAMTTPGASTARTASTEDVNSCVFSSLCPSKTTPVPATCSCFAGENHMSV